MPSLLSQLAKSEQARLLEEMNYMNLEEIRGFCSEREIPYRIIAESADGKVKATKDTDRKPIVLARVRRYLTTGHVGQPTRIPARIVRDESPPARPGPRDRLYYRWYAKEFEGVMRLEHRLLTPVYAYLTDLKHHRADGDWKAVRKAKATSALRTLAKVAPV
jgi:hypothetical protein